MAGIRRRLRLLVCLLLAPVVTASAQPTILDRSDFRSEMRRLWTDHAGWMRLYLISALGNLPDKDEASKRLLKNVAEIGAALKPFYGDTTASRVGALLKDHVMLAGLIFESTNQGDNTMREPLTKRWTANADSVAAVLSGANRAHWPAADLETLLHSHLELVMAELVARVQKEWVVDVAAHDKSVDHALKLADRLSNGIMRQFPRRFAAVGR